MRNPTLPRLIIITIGFCLSANLLAGENSSVGSKTFADKCADCHGMDGQGEAGGFEKPLMGELSIEALAHQIERTMPEGSPEDCVGEEAKQVAAYIYNEFYSPPARIRKGYDDPPRIELSRLTVAQYRNSVADLLAAFTPQRGKKVDSSPGLRAQYYQSKGMTKTQKMRDERVDFFIDYDYGEGSPHKTIEPDQFAIVWDGAVSIDDTGYHEFRVTTQNGARLYVNNDQTGRRNGLRDDSGKLGQSALIDAWVSSGKLRASEARVFLLGGRKFPIRLEFFKYKSKDSSIKLEWKPPHGVWSILDHNHLSTDRPRRTFAVSTPFPADDRSAGYERGTTISREWHSATTAAAIETVEEVMNRLPLLADVDRNPERRRKTLQQFAVDFADIAFRRPLTEAETNILREACFANVDTPDLGLQRAILFTLKSPQFLYTQFETPESSEHDSAQESQTAIAARLALAMWDSLPDEQLREAAEKQELSNTSQIEDQARRMLKDARAKAKLHSFFHHWLELDERDVTKDRELFPEFDDRVIYDLRHSLLRFVDDVVWSDASDYRQLLLADTLLLNERLKQLYNIRANDPAESSNGLIASHWACWTATSWHSILTPPILGSELESEKAIAETFTPVRLPTDQRAGILTHPYLLSAMAYHDKTSPIHRGVFLTRNVVGRALKPPPVAVAFKDDEFAPDLSMREKITQLTSDKACMSCHSIINPMGFALENYDPIGRWRTKDQQQPIDSRGEYVTEVGKRVEFSSARDIANFASKSPAARKAFVTQLFRHMVKQNPRAYNENVIDDLKTEFAADNYNVQNLTVKIGLIAAKEEIEPKHE